ncbi:MAG: DNA-directed RNA polymerase subunit L [Candidatus Micrarchaeia archaeon]
MEIKLIKKEKTELEFEVAGADPTIPELLIQKLNEAAGVENAAYKVEHPIVGNPRIYVKVKRGDPVAAVEKAAKSLGKDISEFRKDVSGMKA